MSNLTYLQKSEIIKNDKSYLTNPNIRKLICSSYKSSGKWAYNLEPIYVDNSEYVCLKKLVDELLKIHPTMRFPYIHITEYDNVSVTNSEADICLTYLFPTNY